MKPARFRYARADSLAEATALLAAAPGDAKLLAGGQSLVPMLNMRLVRPAVLVDVNGLRELTGITPLPDGGLRLARSRATPSWRVRRWCASAPRSSPRPRGTWATRRSGTRARSG